MCAQDRIRADAFQPSAAALSALLPTALIRGPSLLQPSSVGLRPLGPGGCTAIGASRSTASMSSAGPTGPRPSDRLQGHAPEQVLRVRRVSTTFAFIGWDWATETHDVTVMDEAGKRVDRWEPHRRGVRQDSCPLCEVRVPGRAAGGDRDQPRPGRGPAAGCRTGGIHVVPCEGRPESDSQLLIFRFEFNSEKGEANLGERLRKFCKASRFARSWSRTSPLWCASIRQCSGITPELTSVKCGTRMTVLSPQPVWRVQRRTH